MSDWMVIKSDVKSKVVCPRCGCKAESKGRTNPNNYRPTWQNSRRYQCLTCKKEYNYCIDTNEKWYRSDTSTIALHKEIEELEKKE